MRNWFQAVLIAGIAASFTAFAAQTSRELVILHMNDTHGRLISPSDDGTFARCAPRLATMIPAIREENPGRVLLLHAGDLFSRGGPLTIYSGGAESIRVMNAIGFDALTPGNGDFYFGLQNLLDQKTLATFPFLHANVTYCESGERVLEPYCTREINGTRIGILGLGVVRENHQVGRVVQMDNPFRTAERFVPQLRVKCDLLLVLSHLGIEADHRLAESISGIDLIIGGHSHDAIGPPIEVKGPDGKPVYITQAGDLGRFLGRLDIVMKKRGPGIARIKGALLPVDASIPENPEIAAMLEEAARPLNETCCVSEIALSNEARDDGPSAIAEFTANLLLREAQADVALFAPNTVAAGVEKGPVRVSNVLRIHPWRNRLALVELTGAELLQLLESTEALTAGCALSRTEDTMEGLRIGQSPADPETAYTLVTDEFFQAVTPGLKEKEPRYSERRIDQILLEYLRKIEVLNEKTAAPFFPLETAATQ